MHVRSTRPEARGLGRCSSKSDENTLTKTSKKPKHIYLSGEEVVAGLQDVEGSLLNEEQWPVLDPGGPDRTWIALRSTSTSTIVPVLVLSISGFGRPDRTCWTR